MRGRLRGNELAHQELGTHLQGLDVALEHQTISPSPPQRRGMKNWGQPHSEKCSPKVGLTQKQEEYKKKESSYPSLHPTECQPQKPKPTNERTNEVVTVGQAQHLARAAARAVEARSFIEHVGVGSGIRV